jgi:hypothetical protein
MGKHRDDGTQHIEGDLFDNKKEQLSKQVKPGDHIPESSISPIETF